MPQEMTQYDDNTVFKVYDALRKAGLTEKIARNCINEIQNAGVLLRERCESVTRVTADGVPPYTLVEGSVPATETTDHLVGKEAPGER